MNAVYVTCPHCNQSCDISTLESTDMVTCPSCEQVFEVQWNAAHIQPPPLPKNSPPPSFGGIHIRLCPFCKEEILAQAVKCKHCGEMLNNPNKSSGSGGIVALGVVIGLIAGVLFLVAITMDTSVSIGNGERVHNIGLLREQQNLIFISVAGLLFAGGVAIAGWLKSR